jgi:hypothetical protein
MYPGPPVHRDGRAVEYSYAGLLVRADRAELLDVVAAAGFTGYVGPQEADWVVLVPARLQAAAGRGTADLETLGSDLARHFGQPSLTVSVHRDRVLRLLLSGSSRELGRYVSNPAYGADEDDEILPDPQGVEHAVAFAAAGGAPEAAEDLAEVLSQILDEQEQTESERLSTVLRLLGLPRWLVAVDQLPRDVPGGPSAAQVTRLFRGRTGLPGRLRSWLPRLRRPAQWG